MDNREYIERLMVRYVNHEITGEEQKQLFKAMEEDPALINEFELLREANAAITHVFSDISFDADHAYEQFLAETSGEDSKPKSGKLIRMVSWMAGITAVLLIAFFIFRPFAPAEQVLLTGTEQKEVSLPDGSTISLNKFSKLVYPESFNKRSKKRVVYFSGEAYFSIQANPEKPFVIDMKHIAIEVLGTAFNVLQDSVSGFTKVTVDTGKVKVYNKMTDAFRIVGQGEAASYDHKRKEFETYKQENQNHLSWKTGILIFKDTPLDQVVNDLNSYYDVHFIIENEAIKNCRLNTKIDNYKVSEVVEMLELVFDIDIRKEDNTYYLSGEGC